MNNVIAITAGEPAGIGPDITLGAINSLSATGRSTPVIIADKNLLNERAQQLNLNIKLIDLHSTPAIRNNAIRCVHIPLVQACTTGKLNTANAEYVLNCLRHAGEGCRAGDYSAMVTGPVNKAIINDSGIAFSGHTEFLAELDQKTPVMMLATDKLRVALVTTHLPLNQVSHAITAESLSRVIKTLHHDLQTTFALDAPSILVLGLNPHAGEGGHLGNEEITIIQPTLEQLRTEGINLTGPVPADTAFSHANLSKHDAVLAMYHDQGLPVLKYSGFGEAVNITLGLSFIRTSVDHGTALELAGTGQASHSSLLAAYKMAEKLVNGQC